MKKQGQIGLIAAIVIVLGLVILLFNFLYTIGAGERGILLTFAKPEVSPQEPGLHVKVPFVQEVIKMDVQTQKHEAEASAASKDLQTVTTKVALNFHLDPASVVILYRDIGLNYAVKVIDPAIQESVKAATAQFTAEELITKRELVKEKIKEVMRERLTTRNIVVEDLSITNFDFSPEFNQAIELKVTAEQNALTQKNKLEQVKYESEQKVVVANADAQSITLRATAEANAIKIRAEALSSNAKLVSLEAVQKWDGKMPVIMMGSGTPFVDISGIVNQVQPTK